MVQDTGHSFSNTDNSTGVEQRCSVHIRARDAALDTRPQEQVETLLCISPEWLHQGQTRSLQESQTRRDTCPRQEPQLKSTENQAA